MAAFSSNRLNQREKESSNKLEEYHAVFTYHRVFGILFICTKACFQRDIGCSISVRDRTSITPEIIGLSTKIFEKRMMIIVE